MASVASINQSIDFFLKQDSTPIIDLRSQSDFDEGHCRGSSHFYYEHIIERMHELPKRNQALRLIGKFEQIKLAKQKLSDKGYRIEAVLEWSHNLKQQLISIGLFETGKNSIRLWSPAPIIVRFHQYYLNANKSSRINLTKSAIDIGCGAGRDAVYLAMQGWHIDAIDYLPDAVARATQLASKCDVKLNAYQFDIEKQLEIFDQNQQSFDLAVVIRYLHRPLLPILKHKITPGGYLVYQTFLEGCEVFGSPKNPRFLLKRDELADIFNEFHIIVDEVECLEDGRPTNIFIAQKPIRQLL